MRKKGVIEEARVWRRVQDLGTKISQRKETGETRKEGSEMRSKDERRKEERKQVSISLSQ